MAQGKLHKLRNVGPCLPDKMARVIEARMRAAYRNPDSLTGHGALDSCALPR